MKIVISLIILFSITLSIDAQVKILSNGNVGVNNSNPYRKFQVATNTDYSSYMKLHGNFNYNSWQDHSRIEFNDHNWGIGVGDLDATSSNKHGMYFYTYTGRWFRWYNTGNGKTHPGNMNVLMQLDPSGHLGTKAGMTSSYNFTWSDIRNKKNIQSVDSSYLNLLQLNALRYQLKDAETTTSIPKKQSLKTDVTDVTADSSEID